MTQSGHHRSPVESVLRLHYVGLSKGIVGFTKEFVGMLMDSVAILLTSVITVDEYSDLLPACYLSCAPLVRLIRNNCVKPT